MDDANHDWRADNFASKYCPAPYRHHFNLKARLNLEKRNIDHVDYNDWLDVGNVSITHGMYHGTSASKKHYIASGAKSVIYSHVHQYEVRPYVARGKTRHTWSLPAMCNLNPHYLKNSENNWSNGYGVLNVRPSGDFNFNVFTVWDDALVLPNGRYIQA